jgi:DNA-binding transcriptional LysR family regulator
MEFRHLRYFIAVAEALNFSRAARKLQMAQPPLSRQIQQLEAELGAKLFVRDRRKVELTDAGRVLMHEGRILVNQTMLTMDAVRRADKGEYGLVRVGLGSGLGKKIQRVLVQHAKRFPDVDVQCKDILSTFQNEALLERQIDVGFLRPPVDLLHLASESLFEEQFLVFLSKANPLARCRKLKLKQLAGETLLLYDRNQSMGVFDKTLELYRHAGVSPRILFTSTAPHEEAGAMLVASGKGIYLGVGAVLGDPVSGSEVATVQLDEPEARIEVHMAWRKGENSSAVLAFLDSVRRVFKRGAAHPHVRPDA